MFLPDKLLKLGFCFIAAALLSGCSYVTELGPANYDGAAITLTDKRPDSEKKKDSDGPLGSVVRLGDSNFNPSIIEHLKSELVRQKPGSTGHIEFELQHFRIIDFYLARHQSGQNAALAGTLSTYGITYVGSEAKLTDTMVCEIAGTLNGAAVNSAFAVPYAVKPSSATLWNDEHRVAAMREALSGAVKKLYAPSGVAAASGP